MLHLHADWLRRLRLETGIEVGEQGDAARITRAPTLYRQFCRLNGLLFGAASVAEKEAALIEFIGDHDFQQYPTLMAAPVPTLSPPALRHLINRIEQADIGELTVEDLAAGAKLGRYQLIRSFRAATGMTPHAYLLNARVNRARDWLRAGLELAEIAYRLGFADQSHFQRVFKAHAGVTPGHYRMQHAQ